MGNPDSPLSIPNQDGHPVAPDFGVRVASTFTIACQLGLILLAVYLLKIERRLPLFQVLCLASAGFVVHSWLPRRLRLPFFALLSVGAILALLGWPDGGWVLGIGGVLIVLCHLPIPQHQRVLLVAGTGVGLLFMRIESEAAYWPVLGSMFMFRLIVFLFETRRERARPSPWQSLAYFFMLPNLCFPFFPIVSFRAFRETYYDGEAYSIYQTGVAWIVRGLVHLLAFRFVKFYLLPAPHEVTDLPHLVLFMAALYGTYLFVSGWFHIATGMLHLYGFNLPRTHDNYFLASGVTDIWRRINIYWKDFMTTVFLHPMFFALRRWGMGLALALAGLWVFAATWMLHSYQKVWLLGDLPLSLKEAALWLIAGVVVVAAMLLELNRTRQAARSAPTESKSGGEVRAALVHSLKVVATFLLISFFWTCWYVPSVSGFLKVVVRPGTIDLRGVLVVLGCVAAAVVIGVVFQLSRTALARRRLWPVTLSFPRAAAVQTAVLLLLVAIGVPKIGEAFPARATELLATLRMDAVTPVEAAVVVQGYYDEVAAARVQVTPFLGIVPPPPKPGPDYTTMTREADDYLERELKPGWSGTVGGRFLSINQHGMRDREGITKEKPKGTCRIAVVGSSVVMGFGVGDEETFTRRLDFGMNEARPGGPGRFEVLNFGTGKSYAIHRLVLLRRKVYDFDPDAVFYIAHQDELLGTLRHLKLLAVKKQDLLFPHLRTVLDRAGVTPETSSEEMETLLAQYAPEILRTYYAGIVEECRQRGVLPVWVYVPMPGIVELQDRPAEMVEIAQQAGFVVVNLEKWDDGQKPEAVKVDDHHASALGHQLIARHLGAVMLERPEVLPACARPEKR